MADFADFVASKPAADETQADDPTLHRDAYGSTDPRCS